MKNKIVSLIIKLSIVVASMYGVIVTRNMPQIFTYFTTLSNIVIAFVAGVFAILDVIEIITKKDYKNNALYTCKFMATISITLTCLAFMFLLAPTMATGFFGAYGGSSFYLHLFSPVMAILDFILFDYNFKSNRWHKYFALVPPYMYCGYVVIASTLFNVRWGNMMAPYNFLNFGAKTGWFGFDLSTINYETLGIGVAYNIIVLSLIFFGIGALFLKIKDSVKKLHENK